ncbi:PREDICTED: uncharacterized protein LOC109484858 isoform X1 [Branchiostoma belcheri]|uniref:Uncharacterized protein LOC109484858 isoform X1 n=1 Tax=Branchiostoma belcheri TaxID=7741 RepID=A0A6P5AP09_BRABE|nr:PREDICTED: uncharacterized protein LOC109484858 isoform X1 [Branchiostoma belcheri]
MATNNVETDDPGPSSVERPTTAQHRGTLEDFYNNGLTHYGSKENKQKVEAIVQLTGLKRLQVKRWIDNRNRKGKPRSAPKKAVNLFGRGKSGYGGFKSKYMKGKAGPSTLADANRAWSRLTAEEKKTYSEKAKQHVRPTVADLSEDSKQATVRKLIQEMEGVVSKLKSFGCELFCKVTRHGEVWTASTSKAEAFLNDKVPQVDTQFCLAMSGPSTCMSSKASKKDEAKGLRKEAQAMLNAISSSHPELKSKFPYKLLEEGKVVVEGLPEDFKFRKPSDMGVDDLKVLLNYRNSLVIHVQPESTMLSSSSTDASVAGPSRVSPMLMETGTGVPEVVEETTIPEGTECMQQLQSIQAGIEEAPPTEVELISSQEKETERQRERKKGRGKAKGKGKRKREEEGPYFVEKLVGKRMQGGEVQYHVKWQGWPDSANTWEPTSNIHPDTIEIFYPSN